jgi:transcriptional regulator with XRE-family HTH domain
MVDSFVSLHDVVMAPPRKNPTPAPEITEPFLVKLAAYLEANRDKGVTAAGLSVDAGLSNSAIRGWLSGKSGTLTMASARKVCAAMGTTLEEFLSEAQTEEERQIAGLVSQLSGDLLHELLVYGRGLRAARLLPPPSKDEGSQ